MAHAEGENVQRDTQEQLAKQVRKFIKHFFMSFWNEYLFKLNTFLHSPNEKPKNLSWFSWRMKFYFSLGNISKGNLFQTYSKYFSCEIFLINPEQSALNVRDDRGNRRWHE